MNSSTLESTRTGAHRGPAWPRRSAWARRIVRAGPELAPAAGVLGALLVRAVEEQFPLPTGFLPALAAASAFVLVGIAIEIARSRDAILLVVTALAVFAGALLASHGVGVLAATFAAQAVVTGLAERGAAPTSSATRYLLSGWALFHATLAGVLTLGI